MSKPITRKEEYLAAAAGDKVDYPANPITREEAYLQRIAEGGSVEANPEEEPTGTLEKLKVGDGVYAVPSGGGGGTSDYSALNNKPQINGVELSGNKTTGDLNIDYNDLKNKPIIPSAQVQSDWNQTDNSKVDFIKNKPSIPDDLADLNDDASHRTVTDTEKATWNGKSDFSGDYNDLDNKPIIPDAQVQADWNQTDNTKPDFIKNKPNIPAAQIQSDWDQSDDTKADYIKNKPPLGTASAKSVPTSGDAGSGEVVMGNDSRLSDSRPASDVSSWAKQATKPTYTASEVGAIPSTDKGANGGVATLGNDGIVPSSQLPSMFDGDYNSLTNKPTLGTAAAKDVPSAGNASLTEVVMGSDSRLSDDRNAKDVYPWAKAATKPTYTATDVGAIPSTDKGANGGVAELDSNGKVPSSQLPSYVDDVCEGTAQNVTETSAGTYSATGFILSGESSPCIPESGKTYVDITSNIQYRWTGTGTNFVSMGSNLALGETSSTAYRGDRGKVAYDHSQITGNPHGTTAADVGLGNVPNVSTNDQTPTFSQASTRNNIASGEKLSVIFGKIQKFFNDLKTVAFSGSFSDLSNKPSINSVELSGNKTTSDLGLQDELTFDNVPTDGSNNPVKSDGVYDSEKDIYAVMGQMGAKNLIPYPYYEDTEEDRGITWTNNADGTITITGTATADSAHNLSQRINTGKLYLPNGKYKLSGCPSGGSNNTYYLEALCTKNSSANSLGIDNGTGVEITVNGDDYGADGAYVMVRGIVKNGYAVTNSITFFPMLRLASDTDDTYQPYAKTNRELTESYPADKVMMSDGVTSVEDRISANSFATAVSIPASTNYTVTSDGYVIGRCAAGASKQLTIVVNNEQAARAISTADFPMIVNVFVRKGMIVSWTATDQANSSANFIAIS